MQWITELYNKHKDRPIWIAGSGPSLDTYPDDFLDDKLAVVLHNAYLKFPNTTYRYANESERIDDFKKYYPDYLGKVCIFSYPFYWKNQPLMEALLDLDSPNYYFLILRPDKIRCADVSFVERKIIQAKEASAIDFGGCATCLHACMYACIMMGCNPISLIGCDHKADGTKQHFSKASKFSRKGNYNTIGLLQEKGTRALLEACENQGIDVARFSNYEDSQINA